MNSKKRILIICIVFCIIEFIFLGTQVWAAGSEFSTLINSMNGVREIPTDDGGKFNKIFSMILSLIRYAGGGIAVLMVTITGIQYMVSSAQDKADYKKKLIPMGIGAILLFSATQLVAIVGDIALGIGTT